MNYRILYDGDVIGTMVEPGADPPMGLVHGRFHPAPAYRMVQPVFRLYSEAKLAEPAHIADEMLACYGRERDALHLMVTTAEGVPVPVAWVHIDDFAQEWGQEEGYEATFHVPPNTVFQPTGSFFDDPRYWDGFDYWAYGDGPGDQGEP